MEPEQNKSRSQGGALSSERGGQQLAPLAFWSQQLNSPTIGAEFLDLTTP